MICGPVHDPYNTICPVCVFLSIVPPPSVWVWVIYLFLLLMFTTIIVVCFILRLDLLLSLSLLPNPIFVVLSNRYLHCKIQYTIDFKVPTPRLVPLWHTFSLSPSPSLYIFVESSILSRTAQQLRLCPVTSTSWYSFPFRTVSYHSDLVLHSHDPHRISRSI